MLVRRPEPPICLRAVHAAANRSLAAPQANQRCSDYKLPTLPTPGETLKDALQEATKGKGGALSAVAGALGPLAVGCLRCQPLHGPPVHVWQPELLLCVCVWGGGGAIITARGEPGGDLLRL